MFVCTILLGSYASYTWKSKDTDVTFNIGDAYFYCESGFEVAARGLSPVLDYRSGSYHTFKVNNIGKADTKFSVTLNIKSMDDALQNESFKYKLVVDKTGGSNDCSSTSTTACEEVENGSGNFSQMKVGMNTIAPSIELPNNSRYQYYLFMYIDGNMPNDTSMQNSSIVSTLEVCEIVAMLDYNGGNVIDGKEYLKVKSTYEGLPSEVTRDNSLVQFNSNGGSSASAVTVSYLFDGWYLEKSFKNRIVASSSVGTSINHTLYAKWNASQTVTLPTTSRTGYTFLGWYDGSTKVGDAGGIYRPEKSVTLVAKWKANQYKVTLDNGNATSLGTSSVTATYNAAMPKITAPGRKYTITYHYGGNGTSNTTAVSQYTFDGYYTGNGGSGTKYYNTDGTSANIYQISSNTTLHTNWTGGVVKLPAPTWSGYTFQGWYTASTGGTRVGGGGENYRATANITLYAQWTANIYKVTLNNQGATSAGTTEVYYQFKTTKTVNGVTCYYYTDKALSNCLSNGYTIVKPSRTGHTFLGYYTLTNGGGTNYINADGTFVNNIYQSVGDRTLYASWSANTYSITLNNQGATSAGTTTIYETYGSKFSLTRGGSAMSTSANAITKPTRSYTVTYHYNGNGQSNTTATSTYTFGGYYTATNGGGVQYIGANGYLASTASTKGFSANGTLYAKWTGTSLTLPKPTRTGYTFEGWYTEASGGTLVGKGSASYTPSSTLTLYARWSANTYSITLNNQGATSAGTTAIYETYGSKFSLTRGGSAMSTSANAITKPTRSYTVTYHYNGNGQSNTTATSTYTFGGYYTATNGGGVQYIGANGFLASTASTTGFSANGTLYAKWSSVAITLPNPKRTGYTFQGWYTEASGGTLVGKGSVSYTPNSTLTLYAHWSANTYPITLNNQSATSAGTTAIYETYGSKFSLTRGGSAMSTSANAITKPTRSYTVTYHYNGSGQSNTTATSTYTFGGYYTATNGGGVQYIGANGFLASTASTTGFSSNGTLYAKWTGGNVTLPTPTSWDGHTFEGWYTAASGGTLVGTAGKSYNPTTATTIYAHWRANNYKVNFYSNKNYLSGSDQVIVNLNGRLFYKKYNDPCLTAYYYSGEYTGPLLVGTTENSVAYYTSYDTSATLTYSGSFTQNGITYYYSNTGAWMSGNVTDTSGLADRTKYSGITLEEAAKKLLSDNVTSVSESFSYGVSKALTSNSYTKTGFTFQGWSKSPGGSVSYTDKQSVSNLTKTDNGIVNLYAVWKASSYLVNFDDNYQEDNISNWDFLYPERFSITYDSSTKMNTVAVAGAGGWETAYLPIGTINGRKYTLTFDYEVPTAYTALSGYNGVLYQILSSAPTNTDNTDNVIVNNYIPTSATTSKVTKTITFTGTGNVVYFAFNYGAAADGVTTTLKLGNIKIYSGVSKTYGKVFSSLPSASRAGYSFEGWYTVTSDGTKITTSMIMSTAQSYSVYAHWSIPEYTITYNLNGGSVSGNPTSYNAATPNITLNNPTKSNYTFLGWYGSNDLSSGLNGYTASNPYTASSRDHILGNDFSLATNATYRIFVTGKRTAGTLEMQGGLWYTELSSGNAYDSYGGTFTKIEDLSNGYARYYKDIVVPSGKTKGKFYIQFEQDSSGGTTSWSLYDMHVIKVGSPVVIPKGSSGNKTYTAIFTKATMTITLNANGGVDAGITSLPVTYDSGNYSDISWNLPTRNGYSFLGYYDSSDIQVYSSSGFAVNGTKYWNNGVWIYNGNLTVYAKWIDNIAPSAVTVTYNGGSNTCSWKNNYNITLSATDYGSGLAKYQVDWNSDGVVDQEIASNNFVPPNGYSSCKIRFRAVDNAGNVGEWTSEQHIHMDTQAPSKTSINLNGYTSGTTVNATVKITPSATDNVGIAKYEYSHDNSNWSAWPTGTDAWDISWNGSWYFYLRAIDHAGNIGPSSDVVTVKVSKAYYSNSPGGYYTSLSEAIANTNSGGGIQLLYNMDNQSATFDRNITFNLSGNTLGGNTMLTINSGVSVAINGSGTMTTSGAHVVKNSGYLTIQNVGNITGSRNGAAVYNQGQMTIDNSTITGVSYYAVQTGTTDNKVGLTWITNSNLKSTGHHTLRNYSTQTWPTTSTSGYQHHCTEKCAVHVTGSGEIRQEDSTNSTYYAVMNEYGHVHFPQAFTGTIYNKKYYVLRSASRGKITVNGGTVSADTKNLYSKADGGTITFGGNSKKVTH